MTESISNLPLFPYAMHVLPGGRLPIRIIEDRYIRMVKESYKRQHAFAVCMLNEDADNDDGIYRIATLVKIIDFELLDDSILGIIVEGIQNLNVQQVKYEVDGLRVAECELMPIWQKQLLEKKYQLLAEQYQRFLCENPKINELYPDANYQNATWLAQRWLELLPFSAKDKQIVIGNNCVDFCLEMISDVEMNI